MNDVQKTIIEQVRYEVFVKNTQMAPVDDVTVRFKVQAKVAVHVSYNRGSDLYDVSVHKAGKDYSVTTTVTEGVYADSLKSFFPTRLHKDDNVKGMFIRAAPGW